MTIINDNTYYAIIDDEKNIVGRFQYECDRDLLYNILCDSRVNGNNHYARIKIDDESKKYELVKGVKDE